MNGLVAIEPFGQQTIEGTNDRGNTHRKLILDDHLHGRAAIGR